MVRFVAGLLFALIGFGSSIGVAQPAKAPAERLDGPPIVSAKGWAILDGKTGQFLWGDNDKAPLVLASTTKMMTAWIVLQLAADNPKVLDEIITFTERADKTGGTTAGVKVGERIAVRDLLYGLLLPSGNDAATALAEHFGSRFKNEGKKDADSLALFIAEMNRQAKKLEMTNTEYFDPHGLGKNHASPRDLAVLAWNALKNPKFADYVKTRHHECEVTDADGKKRQITWDNTNRLLGIEGYEGVKTGTTTAAGSCLVASGKHNADHLIVVVLGATSNDSRYVDARNLFRWAWRERAATTQPK